MAHGEQCSERGEIFQSTGVSPTRRVSIPDTSTNYGRPSGERRDHNKSLVGMDYISSSRDLVTTSGLPLDLINLKCLHE